MAAALVIVVILAAAALGGLLGGQGEGSNALEKIKDRGTLIVGINVPWEPFETYNVTSKQYEGFDIDVMTKVAQSIGVDVEFRSMDFDALLGAVETGQIDVAISSIPIRPDRVASVDFSAPYYITDQAVIVRDDSAIKSMDDLNGTVIAARHDTTGHYWIESNLSATGVAYDTVLATVLAVEMGQDGVRSAVLDSALASRYADDPSYHLKIASIIPTNERFGIACPKGEEELVRAIDDAISAMRNDGSLEAMLDRWA